MRKINLIIVFTLFSILAQGQSNSGKWSFETSVAAKVGWWIHHKGSTGGAKNDGGWDRSHYNPKIDVNIGIGYTISKVGMGVFIGYSGYFEDDMLHHEDVPNLRNKIPVSKGVVSLLEYGLNIHYNMLQTSGYAMSPTLGIGKFNISTIHPDADNFGNKIFWQLGFRNLIKSKKVEWIIEPQYQEMKILNNNSTNDGERHKIYSFGLKGGIRYELGKK